MKWIPSILLSTLVLTPYLLCLSCPPPGEAPPAGCRPVSAVVQTESCSQGSRPSSRQGQGELHGGDPEAQVFAQHQKRADSNPQTGAQG